MSSPPPGGGQFGSKTSPDGGNVHKCATPRLVREIGRHRHPGDTGYIFKTNVIIILSLDLDLDLDLFIPIQFYLIQFILLINTLIIFQ